ncbi:ABC transporter ATP-binding protein [Litoribacter ruber]|uniref:ABC transporter ATP-binding protein n=1 Tax=Litoribacter ruber TaxID=702568 RepID=A0AAP2G3K7_9BACT|nr:MULTISPECIES: ABC transporter ATP-binding protein [Litoribacter]MBS9523550.1 ABC transporter ATP-binding protein [Litoribacter alkaliphilus]MBT0812033.1 ABC transporter ATP-binding protein [Litoribacter ruber]
MTILELQSVEKKYSQAENFAVKDVSFKVTSGEILALVGESGSGKTTLLRLIAGLEHPDNGIIYLSGNKIVEGRKSVPSNQRKVGMVFQDYALFPHLTILENVKFGLPKNLPDPEKVAKDTLKLVGLSENFSKYPHQLSGGQQQRVALARAIAPQPSILLMDEPFSNLDAMLKDQVREEIRQIIKKTGVTAIFVTHDTRDALSTADRIAILHKGRLQQIDSPRNLYEKPVNAYVANFFGKRNEILATPTVDGFYTPFGFIADERSKQYSEKVRLLFRPEHATLYNEVGQVLNGSIFKVSYYGDHQIVKLADEDGKRVSIKTSPHLDLSNLTQVGFSLDYFEVEPAF